MLNNQFKNKTVLITGAAGSIGREIAQQLIQYDCTLILLDQAESPLYDLQQELNQYKTTIKIVIADVSVLSKLSKVFKKFNPDIVYHAAAYKHVPLMELNPDEAIRVNVSGTINAVDLSIKHQVKKFIFISTDKAVNPSSVMGATKRIGELYIDGVAKNSNTSFIIVRFGNVLESNGSIVPLLKKQLENKVNLTITHQDVSRYFMSISNVCKLIIKSSEIGEGYQTFLFDMGNPIKIIDVAKKIIKKAGLNYPNEIDIDIIGLRHGEKITEELLRKTEEIFPTIDEKIMLVKDSKVIENIANKVSNLINNYEKMSNIDIVNQLKKILPEYKPQNSVY